MIQQQRQQLDQRLKAWRDQHLDAASLRAAYRQQILNLTLNSMALECEPVEATRLQHLLAQPAR